MFLTVIVDEDIKTEEQLDDSFVWNLQMLSQVST